MIELSIHNLTKFYGANQIFEAINFEVKTGERIGLIGRNGCGKTTIMKIIMGKYLENNFIRHEEMEEATKGEFLEEKGTEEASFGEIHFRKNLKIGYLNQIPVYHAKTKTIDVIRMAFQKVFDIKSQLMVLERELERAPLQEQQKILIRYGQRSQEYEAAGGYELETKILKITDGLKIDEALKERSFQSLSGGEKTRVILAKMLLEEPDIMLLDEPTNHLDLETVEWLEGFLKDYKGSVLLISHDRFFLDHVVTKIVELEAHCASIYMGNYSYYVLEKERRFLSEYNQYINQQKKIERMEMQIKRYRIWGNMRDSETMFKRAKELQKRLEKIEVLDRPKQTNRKVRLNQESVGRSGKIVLNIQQLKKSFGDKKLLENVDIELFYQERACMIGRNGCGKSTLLKMILGEEKPDNGMIKIGAQVHIGYLPQQVIFEDEEATILDYFSSFHKISYEEARNQLAKALFLKEDVHKKIKFLSGGEKSRLRLCSLTYEKANFLILDEPTNHLDIDSREVLEETLKNFEGTLLFVSHDRYFINKIADRILSFEKNRIVTYAGDYTFYQEEQTKRNLTMENKMNGNKANGNKMNENNSNFAQEKGKQFAKKQQEQDTKALSRLKKPNPKKIEIMEEEIESLERKRKELEQKMNQNVSDCTYLEELFEEKEATERQLDLAYQSWEEYQ